MPAEPMNQNNGPLKAAFRQYLLAFCTNLLGSGPVEINMGQEVV